jgi:hypothetical protein
MIDFELIEEMRSNKKFGFDSPWEEFIKYISILHPSDYGPRIEKRLEKEYSLLSVPSKEEKGDLTDGRGNYIEIKTSILTHKTSRVNLYQIRWWQPCHYFFPIFDIRNDNFNVYAFKLTKRQVKEEMKLKIKGPRIKKHELDEGYIAFYISPTDRKFYKWKNEFRKTWQPDSLTIS